MQGFRLGDPGQQHYWDSHSFPLTKRQLLVLRCYYVEKGEENGEGEREKKEKRGWNKERRNLREEETMFLL